MDTLNNRLIELIQTTKTLGDKKKEILESAINYGSLIESVLNNDNEKLLKLLTVNNDILKSVINNMEIVLLDSIINTNKILKSKFLYYKSMFLNSNSSGLIVGNSLNSDFDYIVIFNTSVIIDRENIIYDVYMNLYIGDVLDKRVLISTTKSNKYCSY